MDTIAQPPTRFKTYQQPAQPSQVQSPAAYYAAGYTSDPARVYVQPAQPAAPAAQTSSLLNININDWQFWKGALLGAAATLLITNESVQKGVMKMISKAGTAAQSGVEEIKEKFEDARAEAQAEIDE